MEIDAPWWYWLAFGVFVTVLLALDLFVFHRSHRDTTMREAAITTLAWCAVAGCFGIWLWIAHGGKPALLFMNGYLVEWSLSMDNVFVFAVIFAYFKVPLKYQHRVLFWGIIGAIVSRLVFILLLVEVLEQFTWVIYLLAAFLIYTGIKLLWSESEVDPEKSLVLRFVRKFFRVSKENHGHLFFVREAGKRCMTPLFVVLLVIDGADIAFAVDSVPAIIAITPDRFLIFTSNIFAIMGLRALYFLLAGAMDLFRYLRFGLSGILIFVGFKMLAKELGHLPQIEKDWDMSPTLSLLIVGAILASSILASVLVRGQPEEHADSPESADKTDSTPTSPH